MTELDLVQKYQVLSSVATEARKIFDRALRELVEAERAAERAGCAIDARGAKATIVWNGFEVWATLACPCGTETSTDIRVSDFIECAACHRVWRPVLTIVCELATEKDQEKR